jgi:hypothetical protein
VRAHPYVTGCNLPEHLIKVGAILTVGDRVNPHEDAFEAEQLLPNGIDRLLVEDNGNPCDAGSGECAKQKGKANLFARVSVSVPAAEDANSSTRAFFGHFLRSLAWTAA